MTHPQLRLAAAKFALDLPSLGVGSVDDLVNAAHAALDDALYADGLAVLASTPNMTMWEAAPHFTAALREFGHTFTSQDDALRYLRLSHFEAICEGNVSPSEGIASYYADAHKPLRYGSAEQLDAWSVPSAEWVVSQWYTLYDFEYVTRGGRPWGHPDAAESMAEWDAVTVQHCRNWCREYARLYLQPAWRSETVVALTSAIRAEHAFDRLPILADALEEAGCDHPDLLGHCRHNAPHADYCWLADAVASGG